MSVGQITNNPVGTSPKLKIASTTVNSGRFTAMCWAFHIGGTAEVYADMFTIREAGEVIGMTTHVVTGTRRLSMGDLTSDIDGAVPIADNRWYHFCMTSNDIAGTSTECIGYLNGVEHIRGTLVNPVTGPNDMVLFNSRESDTDGGAVWVGYMAAVKVWDNVALTPEEIRAEMWSYMPARLESLYALSPLEGLEYRVRNHAGPDWATQSSFFTEGAANPPGVSWDVPFSAQRRSPYSSSILRKFLLNRP